MSTTVKWDMTAANKIAAAKVTINTATTTSFDFGTPDDINLQNISGYSPGDRILLVLTASTAGTTDSLTWVVQDAPDNGSGAIGSTATAVTAAVAGALAAGTSDDFSAIAVQVQFGRPWLRVRVTSSGATDTFVTHCSVYAIPGNV